MDHEAHVDRDQDEQAYAQESVGLVDTVVREPCEVADDRVLARERKQEGDAGQAQVSGPVGVEHQVGIEQEDHSKDGQKDQGKKCRSSNKMDNRAKVQCC